MQFLIRPTSKFCVMGRSECGKTTISRHLQSFYPRCVIFDTLEEYTDGTIVYDHAQFSRVLHLYEHSPQFRIIYRLDPLSSRLESDFHWALYCLYEWGSLQIVLEEVQELTTPHSLPRMLKRVILTGRHQDISVLCTTQRPGELHKTLLSQCGHVFTGNLFDKNDVNYVAGYLGRESRELIHLPNYNFLYFRPGEPIRRVELVGNTFRVHNTLDTESETLTPKELL